MVSLDDIAVLIRGGGEMASGVAWRLHQCGFKTCITETNLPRVQAGVFLCKQSVTTSHAHPACSDRVRHRNRARIPPGGGDAGVMASFVQAARGSSHALTSARESLESHLMAFAAEEARNGECTIDMATLRSNAERMPAHD